MYYNTPYATSQSLRNFMYKVYGWMAAGLLLTAATAYYIFYTPAIFNALFASWPLLLGLFIAQIGLVVVLQSLIGKMNFATAALIFLTYSMLTGITLSSLFAVYEMASLYMAFAITAITFGSMALYGYLTNDDLTSIGSYARMGLFGIIIAMLINIFLRSPQIDYITSLIGVGVFTLLTAYDSQKIKQFGSGLLSEGYDTNRVAILGALVLYLDFLNLFLMILRLLGKRRED